MGPFEFARVYGLQQHNVYLQAFIVYGWTGGMAYILLLLSTLWIGLRTVLVPTPWQPYLIAAYATFVGEVLEGFIIDSDHWRHFYLLARHDLGPCRGNLARAPAAGRHATRSGLCRRSLKRCRAKACRPGACAGCGGKCRCIGASRSRTRSPR